MREGEEYICNLGMVVQNECQEYTSSHNKKDTKWFFLYFLPHPTLQKATLK